MIINIDSDNTVYDFITPFADYMTKTRSKPFSKEPEEYNLVKAWELDREEFYTIMSDQAYLVFTSGTAFPGAVDTIRDLIRAGHDVRIVTHKRWPDRPTLTRKAITATLLWYQRVGLMADVDFVFTAGDKQSYPADVVIDDKPDLSWVQPSAVNLLFDRSWNRGAHGLGHGLRVRGWTEVRMALKTIGVL